MQIPENAMFHRHLVLAYTFTWVLQLGYLGYVLRKLFSVRKQEFPGDSEDNPKSINTL